MMQKAASLLPDVKDLPVQPGMPDPLITGDGKNITTARQWEPHRAEMKRLIAHYAVGTMPPPPGNVRGREIQAQTVWDGRATFRLVHLSFGPGERLGFDVALFIPTVGKAPFPTIVHPSFSPTPGTGTTDGESAAKGFADALERGYAVLTYDYQTTAIDKPETRTMGFFPAYPGYDWGAEGAWAWAISRCVDYLQTEKWVDKKKILAVGHSRLGKATLIAGAFDERFALVAPAGSGCFGTGAYRFCGKGRGGKEGLEAYTVRFPFHVSPRLPLFAGQVGRLPFDQHWLVALVAPRPFIAAEAISDPYCNGNAAKQTFLAAKPVFALLGVPERLGWNFRPGGHALTAEDWAAILDFSDGQLRGRKISRRFDQFPPLDRA